MIYYEWGKGNLDRNIPETDCSTHNQKFSRHPNFKTYPDRTHVGLQDHQENRKAFWNED
jgi:hypothetical protein